jgi:hypothetical protein
MAISEYNGLLHQSIIDFEHEGWHHALSLEAKQCFIRPTFDNFWTADLPPAMLNWAAAVCLDSIADSSLS